MGQGIGGGVADGDGLVSKVDLPVALVVKDVHIIKEHITVQVPKFVDKVVEVAKFIPKEITVIDVKVKVEEKVVNTYKLKTVEEEVKVQKPVFENVTIIKPVLVEKEILEPVIRRVDTPIDVPRVVERLVVKEVVEKVTKYKLVEEIVKVPKIKYIPTEVERIVWKDVERERCSHCRREV